MSTEISAIIKRLQECIKNSEFSYVELEKKTGIAKSSIQRYVSGSTKKIPIDAIQAIAEAVGVTPEYILGWDKEIQSFDSISLTPHETSVITAYRDQPEMQPAVDKLLGVETDSNTVTLVEVARTAANRKSIKTTQVTQDELEIFNTTPQSDEKL